MKPPISHIKLSETLGLSECHDGWWLFDNTRGMNLSMRAKTSTEAFVEALTYYQRRLMQVEQEHLSLSMKVDAFVGQFHDDEKD